MEVLLLNNFMDACLGRMGYTKICILIIIKSGCQCKGGAISPNQSEDPFCFELLCFISNCFQWIAENIYLIYIYIYIYIQDCISEKYSIKLFI